ncbi:MAG: hypothetical protein K6F32_04145 [Bacilli bacterium]|nr:hypothetical protein [Bacilli bacterium]
MGLFGFKSKEERMKEAKEKQRQAEIRGNAGGVEADPKKTANNKKANDAQIADNQAVQREKDALDAALRTLYNEMSRKECDDAAMDAIRDDLLPQIRALQLEGELFDMQTTSSFLKDAIKSVMVAVQQGDKFAAIIGKNFIQEWISKLSTPGFTKHFHNPKYVKSVRDEFSLRFSIERAERILEQNRLAGQKIVEQANAKQISGARAQAEIDKLKVANGRLRNQIATWNNQLNSVQAIISAEEMVNVAEEAGSMDLTDRTNEVLDRKQDMTDDLNSAAKSAAKLDENNLASTGMDITGFSVNEAPVNDDAPATLDLSGL